MTAAVSPRFVSRAPKLGFVGWFDGLRGVGVCMVLVGHALFEYFESWVTIVDTFFVLSGFLIASLLLQEARSTGTISLRKFFIRRGVRLLPSVWLFVTVWLVLGAIGDLAGIEGLSVVEVAKDALAAVTYTYHVVFPNGLFMVHPNQQDHRTMWHLWTLSVEEHFYFVIPGLVLVCLRRNWLKVLGVGLAIGVVGIGVARLFAYTGPVVSDGTFAGIRLAFLQRPDALMLGVLVAIVNAHLDQERVERLRRPIQVAGWLGFAAWFAALNLSSGFMEKVGLPYFTYLPDNPTEAQHSAMAEHWYWFRFGHSLGAVGFALLMFMMLRQPGTWLDRMLCWSPFRWMGRMSYTLYVWHGLSYVIVLALTGGDDVSTTVKLVRTPILIASAFAVALPVYHLVELRVMGMKLKFASEKETVDVRTGTVVQTPGNDAGTDAGKPAGTGES